MAKYIFSSKYNNHIILLEPDKVKQVGTTRELIPGEKVQFQRGVFITENEKLANRLQKHPAYDIDFTLIEKRE